MRRSTVGVAALAVVALLAAACGGDDDTATQASTGGSDTAAGATTAGSGGSGAGGECTDDQVGGEITIGVSNEVTSFDPSVSQAKGIFQGIERAAVFDVIMQYDQETGEFRPRMAESLEPNDDLTQWTLTLRDDVTFASGAPVDTAAVEYWINRHVAPDSLSGVKPTASIVEEMEIVDDQTMVFHLRAPWGNFPSLLAGTAGMIADPAVYERLGAEEFANNPKDAGTGPYRVSRFAPGEELVLEARDDYWDGPVCIETLRFVELAADEPRYDAFANDEFDAAFLRNDPVFVQAQEDDVDRYVETVNGGTHVGINAGAKGVDRPGSDVRIRQAIAYALDAEVIDQRVTGGIGNETNALVPESSNLYTDEIEGLPYDPDRARQLLEEVKADTGYDGSLHFLCNNKYVDPAIAIEGMLEAVGFDVDLDNDRSIADWAQHYTATADFDIVCGSMAMTDAQPWVGLSIIMGASWYGYDIPAMDEALLGLREASTLEERQAAMVHVQQAWNETVPGVVYGHVPEFFVWHDHLEGIEFTVDTIALFDDARIIR